MNTKMLTIVAVLTALGASCDKQNDGKLCSGVKLETHQLPHSFDVTANSAVIGQVTIAANGDATFVAAGDADAEALARFQPKFDAASSGPEVSFSYSDRVGDTRGECGAVVKKGTPQYADAFERFVYSAYFGVAKPTEPPPAETPPG